MKKTNKTQMTEKEIKALRKELLTNRALRRDLTSKSHYWFFHVHLSHYVTHPTAAFQNEMLSLSEEQFKLLGVMAFRGSGKSTILNLSYALWSILGIPQKKCVLIVGGTRELVVAHMLNIKQELESNELLRDDLGPFKEESDKWGTLSLVLPNMNARIIGVARGQSVRGIRHGQYRPDLIICDDLEDSASVKTKRELNATSNWFRSEVWSAGDIHTQIVVLGNLLHKKSLLMGLREKIESGDIDGVFRAYPLLDNNNKPLWPDKFSPKQIASLEAEIADKEIWQQEYMLTLPYDKFYDMPETKLRRRLFLERIECEKSEVGNRIYSFFLREVGFQISAPYGQEDFDEIENAVQNARWKREQKEEEERKSRPPTPEEIREQEELEKTRIRPADYKPKVEDTTENAPTKSHSPPPPIGGQMKEWDWDAVRRHALDLD